MTATPILTQLTTITFNSVAIGGVRSITGIGSGSASEINLTTLASTAKEFAQGLRDFGSIELDLIRNQDDLGQLELFNSLAAQTTETIVVTLPSSTANVITFQGFVVSLPMDIAADKIVEGKCKIRITGPIIIS